ncbi:MAG: hypothetical protein DHS20C14_18370 [Phycisphaeraceae bacterium]|nr:MAG: hypothetical protein DHS20C14_18370 [Phycisphaeraceae bacterium]
MSVTGSSKPLIIVSWVLQIAVAGILAMAAFAKLSGDPGSVAMFEFLGAPWGRLVVGAGEALAVVLLLVPRATLFGAMLSSVLMIGAVGAHLTKLGISLDPATIAGDNPAALESLSGMEGPTMFIMAVGALAASIGIIVLRLFIRGGVRPEAG